MLLMLSAVVIGEIIFFIKITHYVVADNRNVSSID